MNIFYKRRIPIKNVDRILISNQIHINNKTVCVRMRAFASVCVCIRNSKKNLSLAETIALKCFSRRTQTKAIKRFAILTKSGEGNNGGCNLVHATFDLKKVIKF